MVSTLLIIFNLIVLEILLSIDNASVLAIMVKDLPPRDRNHALRYGLLGAFTFRGLSLFVVSWLSRIVWLKIAGGLYLLWMVYGHFSPANDSVEEAAEAKDSKIYRLASRIGLNRLWATVVLVEIMDMTFSVDNIFASVAITSNFVLIMIGVFIGIIAMRFVAQWFSSLILKYPTLERSAFIVIALLGLKLICVGCIDLFPQYETMNSFVHSHAFDFSFSGVMLLIFFLPLLSKNKTLNHAL